MSEGVFEVSDDVFTAVNAVEGIYLNADSKKRLAELDASDLTPDMKRNAVRQAYRKKTEK